jgi:N-acetylmuramoyl-L-alanine amidase CwlA
MVHGRQPQLGMEPTCYHADGRIQGANNMVERMKEVMAETEVALNVAARDMKRYYDTCHHPCEFKVRDKVWFNAKDLTTEQPLKKLDYKQLGPFKILRKVDNLAYKLSLPASFKIHPVISVS